MRVAPGTDTDERDVPAVRFIVGTMIDIARGRRPVADMTRLLAAEDNASTSPPAPPHALYLEIVRYPRDLYLGGT